MSGATISSAACFPLADRSRHVDHRMHLDRRARTPIRAQKLEARPPASTQRNSLRKLTSNTVNSVIESNLIDWDAFINDDFDAYFKARVMALLDAIEFALGKSISDRGTEETVKRFGRSLE